MTQTIGSISITDDYGNVVSMPNYASWMDFALDKDKTIEEKVQMIQSLQEYMDGADEDYPKWNDGSPVMVGQIAMSLYGPMTIGRIEVRENGYTLYSPTGYEINSGTKTNPCERYGELQDYWPGNDDNFAEHVFYHEAMGLIGPQCEGGKYSWELGLHPPYCTEDPRFPKGIDHRIPVRCEV